MSFSSAFLSICSFNIGALSSLNLCSIKGFKLLYSLYSSVLIEELKKDESHRINEDYKATQLVNADFIKGIVEQFNYEIKAGLKLINEYNSLKPLMLHRFNEDSAPILKLQIDKNAEENDISNNSP